MEHLGCRVVWRRRTLDTLFCIILPEKLLVGSFNSEHLFTHLKDQMCPLNMRKNLTALGTFDTLFCTSLLNMRKKLIAPVFEDLKRRDSWEDRGVTLLDGSRMQ